MANFMHMYGDGQVTLFPSPPPSRPQQKMSSFFDSAYNMKFSGGQSFTHANTVIHNIFNHPALTEPELASSRSRNDDQWVTLPGPRGQRLRLIDKCDMNMLQEMSSATLHVWLPATSRLQPTNPFAVRLETQRKSVKIRKKVRSAEIVQFGDRKFTVVTYELENEGDAEKIRMARMLLPLCEIALSSHDVWFPQLYGVGRSATPTLIYHDEIVNGQDMLKRYWGAPIVYNYLWYNCYTLQDALRDDGTLQKLSIPLSDDFGVWTFNIRTRSWQYDIPSTSLMEDINNDASNSAHSAKYTMVSLPPWRCTPCLDSHEIIRTLRLDFLHLIPYLACATRIQCLTDYVCHGMLTFGAVVSSTEPGTILWHFPSCPAPRWWCYHYRPNISAKYSESFPTLVNLTFVNKTDMRMNLAFMLWLSSEEYQQLRIAYLLQSLPFYNSYVNYDNSEDLVCIDHIRFVLVGSFTSDPTECYPPKYLHVPPLSTQQINGMPCMYWPLATPFFYWSSDPEGQNPITEEDWGLYGIPNLTVEIWIGSSWFQISYDAVWDYFQLDGSSSVDIIKEKGHPVLVSGDPHIKNEDHPGAGNSQVQVEECPNAGDLHTVVEKFWTQYRAERSTQKKVVGDPNSSCSLSLLVDTPSAVGQASIIEISD
ncbi:hypothetical protein L218DRAFT_1080443 [Marasmius fiardii PR-910]|nr:hypothetical protein L218DRAFT_1080443 [Marasmius fiardii PR-910]